MPHDLVVHGGLLVSGQGIRRADVAVTDGVVAEVAPSIDPAAARDAYDATGRYVLPGIIDAHNHPYYHDDIEAFSRAAAAGGVTTLVPFAGRQWHGGDPAQGLVATVQEFLDRGRRTSCLDFSAHVIVSPGDDMVAAVPELVAAGVASFKAFTAFPGARMLDDGQILALMEQLAGLGALCMVHCENGHAIGHLEQRLRAAGRVGVADYAGSRPAQLEAEVVYRVLSLAEVAGCDAYIVHVSAARSVEVLRQLRDRPGPRRYAETCPHYLFLTEQDQRRLGGPAKISPPIRTEADRQALWQAVRDGVIDVVASDASGQTLAGKQPGQTNFFDVPFGLPGVEQMFPLVADGALNQYGMGLTMLAKVFCENPADIFGLAHRKGRLGPGLDGDLLVYDPFPSWTVDARDQHGNSDYSVYAGRQVLGRPVLTVQRGRVVLRDGTVVARPGDGQFLAATTRSPGGAP
ncbi:MAG: amidohydrolase family protein [Micromonosporaceae bacterium]|nr:amidohydrolase family protein [Micromonosporaceae bacterium]